MGPHSNGSGRPDPDQIGAAWEEMSLLTQEEYVKLRGMSDALQQGMALSDDELEWAVTILERTREPIVRSRMMVMLAVSQQLTPIPQHYRDRLHAVIASLSNSENKLDKMSAAHLERALNG